MNFKALNNTLMNIESNLENSIKAAVSEEREEIASYLNKRLTYEDAWDKDELYDECIGVEKTNVDYATIADFDADNIELDDNLSEDYCEGHVTVCIKVENIEGLADLPFEKYFDGDEVNDLRQLRGDLSKYANYLKFLQKEHDCPDYEECTVATLDSYEFEATVAFTYDDGDIIVDDIEFEDYETEEANQYQS